VKRIFLSLQRLDEFARSIDISETLRFVESNFCHDDLTSFDDTMTTNSLDHATNYHEAWENYSFAYQNENAGLTNSYYF
jgi:hypothetical protein